MILLGVTGSIAAYKTVEVLRLLLKSKQQVRVIMTKAATRFVAPLTFQALAGAPVLTDLLDPQGWEMAHLELAQKASVLVVAPASAETLSQLARGGASDLISASALAIPRLPSRKPRSPIFIAPAMHEAMWLHPATQSNVKILKSYGYQFIGPERGPLGRVGDEGLGRMADPSMIVSIVLKAVGHRA